MSLAKWMRTWPTTRNLGSHRQKPSLHLEALEDRLTPATTLTMAELTITPTEGAAFTGAVATFTDSDAGAVAGNFSGTIDWGDGSTSPTDGQAVTFIVDPLEPGVFDVLGTHTYAEEGHFAVQVAVTDNVGGGAANVASSAAIADAALLPGSGASLAGTEFTGVGGNNTSTTAGSANAALSDFKAAIGGVNNGATAAPQNGGFRVITWDGVQLGGADFGGNTTVIDLNNVVGIPINRFQNVGTEFEQVYAVSGPASGSDASTFTTVNPSVTNLFPAFSPTNTFAMFNDNTIDFSFVLPSNPNTAPAPAASKAFGAVFLNVQVPNTTSIELFNGNTNLGTFFVPVGAAGEAEFLGELFASPIITRVSITLGTDVLFSFDGVHFQAGPQADDPGNGHNLVVTDDFVFAEPVPLTDGQTALAAVEGTPVSGTVAAFTDLNPGGQTTDFTATVSWGDGSTSPGAIVPGATGTFTVQGSHTYAEEGTFTVHVLVQDLGGSSVTLVNQAVVAEAPIVGTSVTISAVQKKAFANTTVASFTHAGGVEAASHFSASINWGDGTPASTGTITQNGDGSYSVKSGHTYAKHGTFVVTVTVTETDGASTVISSTALVHVPLPAGVADNPHNRFLVAAFLDIIGRAPTLDELTAADKTLGKRTAAGILAFFNSRSFGPRAVLNVVRMTLEGITNSPAHAVVLFDEWQNAIRRRGVRSFARHLLGQVPQATADLKLVQIVTNHFVGRDPTPAELPIFLKSLQTTNSVRGVIAILVGSQEYFNLAQV